MNFNNKSIEELKKQMISDTQGLIEEKDEVIKALGEQVQVKIKEVEEAKKLG
jgi:hypothetical protein